MATNRLAVLKQMLEQDPSNSFARYGFAMEYAQDGQLEEAVTEFSSLLARDGTYVAAYFHAGQVLEKLGRLDQAKAMYERGLDACAEKGDLHTRAEIEAALNQLPV
ncbi:MAG: tetratricopeptide repeat protein [Bryobacteraceae bacterium]